MLLLKTSPVEIVGYRAGEKDGQPMTRGDGSLVEFVRYRADDDQRYREVVMDKSINGGRPEVGAIVAVTLESRQEAVNNPTGRYVKWVDKLRAVGFEKAPAR